MGAAAGKAAEFVGDTAGHVVGGATKGIGSGLGLTRKGGRISKRIGNCVTYTNRKGGPAGRPRRRSKRATGGGLDQGMVPTGASFAGFAAPGGNAAFLTAQQRNMRQW